MPESTGETGGASRGAPRRPHLGRRAVPVAFSPEVIRESSQSEVSANLADREGLASSLEKISRQSPAIIHWVRWIIYAVTILVAAVFLFAHLGHYALWDDEANTALIGQGVWKTGDTSAVLDHNIVAYRAGAELKNLKERYVPPLQYYIVAPFVGLFPTDTFYARLPFAIAGLLAVFLFAEFCRQKLPWQAAALTSIALIGNVSFWLYCRQCRYYSVSIFLTLGILWLYLRARSSWGSLSLIAVAATLLWACNYLNAMALFGVLAIDCLIWHRRVMDLRVWQAGWWQGAWPKLVGIFVPAVAICVIVFLIWDPLHGQVVISDSSKGIKNRLILFWWNWRDSNRCEFGVLPLILLSPIIWIWRRDPWLLRLPLAIFIYVTVVTLVSPQKTWAMHENKWTKVTEFADVRYLCPLIPVMIAAVVLVIVRLWPQRLQWAAVLCGLPIFFTNLCVGGSYTLTLHKTDPPTFVGSSLVRFIGELWNPPSDPYTETLAWMRTNTSPGDYILVRPDYMTYPLMFGLPDRTYAWQLSYPAAPQFEGRPGIDFLGQILPDYAICYGPALQTTLVAGGFPTGTTASVAKHIHFLYEDLFRPELFQRTFKPVPLKDDDTVDGITILKINR